MGILLSISRMIDVVTRFIGYNVRWLILAAVLVSAGNAIIRKASSCGMPVLWASLVAKASSGTEVSR